MMTDPKKASNIHKQQKEKDAHRSDAYPLRLIPQKPSRNLQKMQTRSAFRIF